MNNEPLRPDPDRLLEQTAAPHRGKLKVFFGACAGVGKTWAMLAEAQRLRAQGLDIVVGVVETHGRKDTAAMLEGLAVLPPKRQAYRGRHISEFDLDAALARRPALILMDELAHSNAPGSRHPKRWQDIEELLEAGIDVFTTVNVQHLESLNDVVSGVTGIQVRETVPDPFFDAADDVVLVDLPPDDLRQRLKEGKVYIAGQAERAIEHFFRKGNLIALRELITEVAPQRAKEARPFRLAVIQLGTYDGTIYNARQVVDKIGHLCDYILFDSAWVGYEQFIPMMADCSPLLLDLNENDPGILVTQSVHKQQAGFSQTSQIHKKDSHIKGQQRYVPHKRMNNAFMMHASTSPFYPLFAALDINAKMHEGVSGRNMWMDCVVNGINARKLILDNCQHIRPFVPELVDGKPWQSYETAQIAVDLRFFQFVPGEHWHSFEGYAENQYFVDPCKLLLTTPGIDARNGEYEAFGVPATILANFLRENGVVPEKCDLNSILFLLTPAEDMAKLQQLAALLVRFEKLLESDAPLSEVLPSIYKQHEERYTGYTLRQLCQEMHDLYARHNVKQLQKEMFRKEHFPRVSMNPQEANHAYLRGEVELIRLPDAEGRIAAEGALPYPPGVLCVVPGEIWGGAVLRYFSALEEGINLLPGFAPELQGVYIEEHDGRKQVWCYVIKPRDAQSILLKGEKL
ncbi:ornithine decarboxylase [Escherichia coli]|nr:hypothetical protein [Escherichia coli]